MFYKVVKNLEIVDVLNHITFVRLQPLHTILFSCQQEYAQGILSSNDDKVWFVADLIKENVNNYPEVKLIEIDEEEYNILKDALKKDEPIFYPDIPDEPSEEEEEIPDPEVDTLTFVKTAKLNELNKARDAALADGFFVDKVKYGFNKTDQQNMLETLTLLLTKLMQGQENAIVYYKPYGAGTMTEYSKEKFMKVVSKAEQHKLTIWSKYNTLVSQVESSSTIQEVADIKWE